MSTEQSETEVTTDRTGVSREAVLTLKIIKLVLGIVVSALTLCRLAGVV